MFNPNDTADNLKKYGGFIPGIRPGKKTADYIDYVLTRLTAIGAAYLVLVCLMPEFMLAQYGGILFYFSAAPRFLIVVSVTMDTVVSGAQPSARPPVRRPDQESRASRVRPVR